MSFKIAFTGAGSIGFTRNLLSDLLAVPEFANIRVAFHDISEANLDMVRQLCQRDIEANGLSIQIEATTDRREALQDARYVICTIRQGGLEAFATDIDIPLKYGVDQCVGDTLAPGGIMYAQRGIAAMLEICRDIREVAEKDCLLLNYSNPMAMLTWACLEHGGVRTIGLCHGVQGGHYLISRALKIEDKSEIDIICAGINHQTWFTQVRHKGKDMTGKLLKAIEADPYIARTEKVRIDMLRRFGYFSTESNGHLSEYVAWYRKRPRELKQWIDMDSWINGETGGYLRVCTESRNWFETDFPNWMKEPPKEYKQENRGEEHGSYIIESLETGRVYRGHFNVRNNGIITNLPADAIIEAPGYVDGNGVSMPVVGDLPLGCAAVCNQSISVQRMAVKAAITGDAELLKQAMLLDPLTAAVCNPPEVWQMADEMLVAQSRWLPQYSNEVRKARKRLKDGPLVKTNENNKGAARKVTRDIRELKKEAQKMRQETGKSDKGSVVIKDSGKAKGSKAKKKTTARPAKKSPGQSAKQ